MSERPVAPPAVMPALDVTLDAAVHLVQQVRNEKAAIVGLKVGSLLVAEHGLAKVRDVLDCGLPLILDMQKWCTDIPSIVREQVKLAARNGIQAVIGAPLGAGSNPDPGSPGALEAFVDSCREHSITPIVVVEMTQPGANAFLRDGASEALAMRLCELGVEMIVAPGNKPERLVGYRRLFSARGSEVRIVSPGVGPQSTGDAVADAAAAVKAGTDYVVVGRAVYTADDPAEMVRRIYARIRQAYANRKGMEQ